MQYISELLSFIRIKVVAVLTLIMLGGYFMFNSNQFNMPLVATSIFVIAAVYGYNNLTDAKEDIINRKKLNKFVKMQRFGRLVVISCILLSVLFSLFLSRNSALAASGFLVIGLAYSKFRLKRFSLVKNITTALIITLIFLSGALVSPSLSFSILLASSLIFIYIMVGSIVSDLRDYDGDRAVGLNTTPVKFGKRTAKIMSNLLLLSFCAIIIFFNLHSFLVLLPFALLMMVHLAKDKYVKAHNVSMLSFLFLNMWLLSF